MSAHTAICVPVLESQNIVRERKFTTRDLDAVIDILHAERATGQVIVDISQGTIGTVRVREQLPVFPHAK